MAEYALLRSCHLLPCVDSWQKLSLIGDWVGERARTAEDMALVKHLRWLVREWTSNRGLQRRDVVPNMLVWARFGNQGFSRAVVDVVTPRKILVEFPNRKLRGWKNHPVQRGERAWWDLEPRQHWNGQQWRKPKARGGYSPMSNAALAALLTFDPAPPPHKVKAETRSLFTEA